MTERFAVLEISIDTTDATCNICEKYDEDVCNRSSHPEGAISLPLKSSRFHDLFRRVGLFH